MDLRRLRFFVVGAVIGVGVGGPFQAGELSREISLIERIGKQRAARRDQPREKPTTIEITQAARTIDQYLNATYRQHKAKPNRPADDDGFLRRVYLDIAGRIPTLEETVTFRNERSRNKRAALIDQLLESEAYIQHNFTFWADLLRIQSYSAEYYGGGQAYANWIKQSLRENKTYDRMVYELLTAKGYPWENGATGFYLRDIGMPLDHMATTVQVFLGTSLQCAQCHDHPFDKWSQYEFYEMAAFTYPVNTRTRSKNLSKAMELVKDDDAARRAMNIIARTLSYGVSDGNAQLRLPHDYQYEDAKPHEVIEPYPIFGSAVQPVEGQSRREAFARWVIDRQNPRFTLTIANRLWKKVFGVGLIEPVEQLTDDSEAFNPELLAFLSYKMESFGYDLRQFERMLYNTELYRRSVSTDDLPEDKPFYFTGPIMSRMTAEQFWDSLMTLIIPEPDYRRGEMSDPTYMQGAIALANAKPQELVAASRAYVGYERQRSELGDRYRKARDAGDEATAQSLTQQIQQLRPPNGLGMMGMMMMSNRSGGTEMGDTVGYGYELPTKDEAIWEGIPPHLVRAAELRSPNYPSHFLREFGQSDRQVINNANSEPNIVQVLASFNGPMFQQVISPYSQLMKNIKKVDTPLEKVQVIFLTVLNRDPTNYEKNLIQQQVLNPASQGGREPDYGKVVWALLNTREFSFVR